MRTGHTFRIPNRLILDGALSYTARRMGAVLYSRRNALGTCSKPLSELANLAQCSTATAQTALKELEGRGYISRRNTYRYAIDRGRMVYGTNVYICTLVHVGSFTFIPRSVFQHDVRASSFLLLLYLYYKAGNSRRAFPSLARISADLDMARSTVCRCVHELGDAKVVYARACIKADTSFSSNSYFFLCQTPGAAARCSSPCPVRPRARRMAVKRLNILLVSRYRRCRPRGAIFPYIRFRPLTERWKPPSGWG